MTQKILDLIEEINREGFDNSMWGVTKVDDWDIVELFGATYHKIVPQHIYIYREDDESNPIRTISPDLTFTTKDGCVIDLYYISNL